MKRKAEETLTPSTPDIQKGWLKSRTTSRQVPNSPPDGPPSPSPRPRTSQKKKKNLGVDPSWTQLGGIAQAGQQTMNDDLDLWFDSFDDNSNDNGNISGSGSVVQGSGYPKILVPDSNDNSAGNDMLAEFAASLRNGTPGRFNNTLNVPIDNFSARKRGTSTTKPLFDQDMHLYNQPQPQTQPHEDTYSNPVQPTNITNLYTFPTTNTNQNPVPNPVPASIPNHINPSLIKPTHLPPSQRLPMILLPSTNPDRPLQLTDEVHLLDPTQSDPSGQITYKITNVDAQGMYTIVPLPVSLRCDATRLLRAPLGEGDIVSVFMNAGVNDGGDAGGIETKQDDWGAITRRWVVNGERRYNVVSWDEKWAGRIWEGLRDEQVGWYDLEGTK